MGSSILNKIKIEKLLIYFLILILSLLLFDYLIMQGININDSQDSKYIINGYRLISISAYDKCIGFELDDGSTKIGTYVPGHVYQYCYNSLYIGIQQVKPAKRKEELDYTSIKYFIIDTGNDVIHSFQSKTDYDKFIIKYQISNLSDWIETLK